MTNHQKQKKTFDGMGYREIQCANSERRTKLSKENQKWLKTNQYRNVGWDNVINLYQKIRDLLEQERLGELTLEELFLEADRIGNKYLPKQEIEDFNQLLSQELDEIEKEIDKHFPDTEFEVVDYSSKSRN